MRDLVSCRIFPLSHFLRRKSSDFCSYIYIFIPVIEQVKGSLFSPHLSLYVYICLSCFLSVFVQIVLSLDLSFSLSLSLALSPSVSLNCSLSLSAVLVCFYLSLVLTFVTSSSCWDNVWSKKNCVPSQSPLCLAYLWTHTQIWRKWYNTVWAAKFLIIHYFGLLTPSVCTYCSLAPTVLP